MLIASLLPVKFRKMMVDVFSLLELTELHHKQASHQEGLPGWVNPVRITGWEE